METGSIEFRKHIKRKFPRRSDEQVSHWLNRVNRELKLRPNRLHKLYYHEDARLSVEEHAQIFTPVNEIQTALEDSRERLERTTRLKEEATDEIVSHILSALGDKLKEISVVTGGGGM